MPYDPNPTGIPRHQRPFTTTLQGQVFGLRASGFHWGRDWGVAEGTPVPAAAQGIVWYQQNTPQQGNVGYGQTVILLHFGDDGRPFFTLYAHLQANANPLPAGTLVQPGDIIGLSGNTGTSTRPHLHFEVIDGAVDLPRTGGIGAGHVGRLDPDQFVMPENPLPGSARANMAAEDFEPALRAFHRDQHVANPNQPRPPIFRCFLAGTPILMADGQEKPIEDIRVGDMVMSFDPSADQGRGALVPKPVSRTFQNITRSIIDLRGLHMTPGHVCLTDDGRFETIAEILLRDGILVEADGTPIRARTGAKVGSMEDTPVLIAYPDEKTGKEIFVRARAGIPCRLVRERDGTMRHLSLALMLRTYHQTLTPDGLILSPDGSFGDATDWPEDSTPMDEDYRRNWVIQTADGKPYVPEWILEVASEAREEQTVGATLRRITSPPSQRFTPKVVDNPTPPPRNRAERRAQKHRKPK